MWNHYAWEKQREFTVTHGSRSIDATRAEARGASGGSGVVRRSEKAAMREVAQPLFDGRGFGHQRGPVAPGA